MPLQHMMSIRRLELEGSAVTDLTPLRRLTSIEILDIGDTAVTDLTPIAKFAKLKILIVPDTLAKTQIVDSLRLSNRLQIRSAALKNVMFSNI
jgi:Leucine-rich repeat (LRR) protein